MEIPPSLLQRPPGPKTTLPSRASRPEPGPRGPHPPPDGATVRSPPKLHNKELTPRAPPAVAELPGPRESYLGAELGLGGPQPLLRDGSSWLGWAPRGPPGSAAAPGPARRPLRPARHAEPSGRPCRGTGCPRPGSGVPNRGKLGFPLTVCRRAVQLALPPRSFREECVKNSLHRRLPRPKYTTLWHSRRRPLVPNLRHLPLKYAHRSSII